MERTNFEKLQGYQLSEKLADSVWNIVIKWDSFAKDTVGKQIVRAVDSIGANISEARDVIATQTTAVLFVWGAGRYTKPFTGCVDATCENY